MLYHLFDLLNPDGLPYAYRSVLFRGTCAILLGFVLVWLIGPRVIRLLIRLKVGDHPEFDHDRLNELMREKASVPTMGGIMIIGTVVFGTLLLARLDNYYVLMGLFCALWLGALGACDDLLKLRAATRGGSRDGLKMYEKLLFQIGLGALMGHFAFQHGATLATLGHGGPDEQTYRILLAVPFYKQGLMLPQWAYTLITVLVITFTSNAVNLTDGIDGLASGCVAMSGFFFMILAAVVGDLESATQLLLPHVPHSGELAVICGAVVGACMGFLWYNCHPAKVFMGDAGSLPLGGLIGYVAIITRQELILIIVGGVFVMEAVSVILQVGSYKLTGKRIFRVAPVHHHFQLGGWTETQTVTRFWLLAAVLAIFALATLKLR